MNFSIWKYMITTENDIFGLYWFFDAGCFYGIRRHQVSCISPHKHPNLKTTYDNTIIWVVT